MPINSYKQSVSLIAFILSIVIATAGCSNKKQSVISDTPTSGSIDISVDESFKPVIDEQIKVFEASFAGAKINVHYKPEAECLKDLIKDSATKMIIVTRGLNVKEQRYFQDSMNYIPRYDKIATDAITIVVNANSTDTVFTLNRLRDELTGKLGKQQQIVFDGLNATSTIRFALDSILHGEKFDTNVVRAVKNSKEVLEYVASDINAIGFVGISWIGNPEDTAQVNMLRKIKIAYVQCSTCSDSAYIKPNQLSILTKRYPLVRGLYYILKENYNGLATGFVDFMQFERGQLIFKRAYLGSSKMGFAIRDVKINEKLVK
jgi:phosphate transport system substrate-binding protein